MAKNLKAENQRVLNELRRKLLKEVSRKAEKFADGLSDTAAEVFVNNARARLDMGTRGYTQGGVETVKNNINAVVSNFSRKYYTTISVKRDPEGLNMFLEYGTGILGSHNRHPDADTVGWRYAVNRRRYRKHNSSKLAGFEKYGWFFSSKKGTYIGRDDEHPVVSYKQKEPSKIVTIKKGKYAGKTYEWHRRIRYGAPITKSDTVFSQGIYPVRYFYNTRIEFVNIFNALVVKAKSLSDKGEEIKLSEFEEIIKKKKL